MAVLDVTTALPKGEAYWSLQLIGADGAVYADDQHNMQLLYAGGSPAARLTSSGDATVLSQLEAFVGAVNRGADAGDSVAAGVLALEVAEAATASAASGRAAARTEDGYVSSSGDSVFRVAVLSVVKHDYVPLGLITHPRFDPVVVADDAAQPEWVHERNQKLADELNIPYVRDVEAALRDYDVQVACVSPRPSATRTSAYGPPTPGCTWCKTSPCPPWSPSATASSRPWSATASSS